MTELGDDLRAARALIDTPEKWRRAPVGARHRWKAPYQIVDALIIATNAKPYAAFPLLEELWLSLPPKGDDPVGEVCAFEGDKRTTHADIMALFDRAILASEQHNG